MLHAPLIFTKKESVMSERQWGTTPLLSEIGEVSTDGWFKYYNWHNYGYEKITRGSEDCSGHFIIYPTINGKSYTILIHRLMAEVFIPIPKRYKDIPIEKLVVHHDDGNAGNNTIENLRWLTHSEHSALHNVKDKSKSVVQLTKGNVLVEVYASAREAGRKIGKKGADSFIGKCCNGKKRIAYGSKWMWYEDWLKSV